MRSGSIPMVGGAAANPHLAQAMADALNRQIRVGDTTFSGVLGAAAMAAPAMGWADSVWDAAAVIGDRDGPVYDPEPDTRGDDERPLRPAGSCAQFAGKALPTPRRRAMIDGLLKDYIDPLWERLARPAGARGIDAQSGHRDGAWADRASPRGPTCGTDRHWSIGLTLAVAFAFDALDGAVARQTGLSSRTGGYFDAMVDRYQELIVLIAIAHMTGHWALALLAFSGAMLTSYAKARTAIEIPVSNTAWPDVFERLERIIYLCAMLILAGITVTDWVMTGGLAVYALLCHATALQRIRRAVGLLKQADQDRR